MQKAGELVDFHSINQEIWGGGGGGGGGGITVHTVEPLNYVGTLKSGHPV